MTQKLKPITPKRIADQVFEQLYELIFRGEFKPGQKILTEREMSEAFQVSRTSVRDAINKLVAMGILEQRQGQGTFVCRPGGKIHAFMANVMSSQNAGLKDLLEVRMGLECNAAALAAKRAGDDDIEMLEKSLAEIEKQVSEGRLGSSADTQFHMAIAYATRNPLQVFLMKQFYDFLAYGIKENLFTLSRESRRFATIQKQHVQIVSGIKARDPGRAYLATKQHIEYVIQTIREQERAVDAK